MSFLIGKCINQDNFSIKKVSQIITIISQLRYFEQRKVSLILVFVGNITDNKFLKNGHTVEIIVIFKEYESNSVIVWTIMRNSGNKFDYNKYHI